MASSTAISVWRRRTGRGLATKEDSRGSLFFRLATARPRTFHSAAPVLGITGFDWSPLPPRFVRSRPATLGREPVPPPHCCYEVGRNVSRPSCGFRPVTSPDPNPPCCGCAATGGDASLARQLQSNATRLTDCGRCAFVRRLIQLFRRQRWLSHVPLPGGGGGLPPISEPTSGILRDCLNTADLHATFVGQKVTGI
jgi:hypothetical protein